MFKRKKPFDNKLAYIIAKRTNPCFYVYIVECLGGTYYTGYTNDLSNRITRHKNNIGAKYTRSKGFKRLIYFENHSSKETAMKREYVIKKAGKTYKEMLVAEFQKNLSLLKD